MTEATIDSPFARAAAYYDAHRAPYAPEAIAHVVRAFRLAEGAKVLDLGCGPGTLAIAFAKAGARVTAVDPSREMLAEARRLSEQRGVTGVTWIEARAEDVLPPARGFRLICFGQSLHWMERDPVLALAADALEDGGGIAIFDEGARRPQESWEATAASVAARYVERRSYRHPGKHPEVSHEPCLQRSRAFGCYEIREFPHAISRDIASVLGCVYSGVGVSPDGLGERRGAFEADLTAALLALQPDGVFQERLETAVIIAGKLG